MKSKYILILIVFLAIVLVARPIIFEGKKTKSDRESTEAVQNNMSAEQVIKRVRNLEEDNYIATNKNSPSSKAIVAIVENENVTIGEIEELVLTTILFKGQSDDIYKEAFDEIKIHKKEVAFARQYNLKVSAAEIQSFVEYQKDILKPLDEDDEAIILQKLLLEKFDYTEEEYYREFVYKRAEKLLIHGAVNRYIKENDMKLIKLEDIQYEFVDSDYEKKIM